MKPEIILLPEFADLEIEHFITKYKVDGVNFQRVTTALGVIHKPALIPWAKRVTAEAAEDHLLLPESAHALQIALQRYWDEDDTAAYHEVVRGLMEKAKEKADAIRDEAADLGQRAHAAVHKILSDGYHHLEDVEEDITPAVLGAVRYVRDFGIDVIATEMTIWDPELGVAGTFDMLGWMGDKLVLADWKRSPDIYPEHALQGAAYAYLLKRVTGHFPDEVHVVKLPRREVYPGQPMYEMGRVWDLPEAWETYKTAVTLQRAMRVKRFEETKKKDVNE